MSRGRPLEIAIIGMGCRFPGAPDLFAYWENILAGRVGAPPSRPACDAMPPPRPLADAGLTPADLRRPTRRRSWASGDIDPLAALDLAARALGRAGGRPGHRGRRIHRGRVWSSSAGPTPSATAIGSTRSCKRSSTPARR